MTGWTLRILPPDILNLILTSQDSSHMILPLWMCGDLSLNLRLAESTEVRLRAVAAYWEQLRMPSLLYQLPKLRTLSIKSHCNLLGDAESWRTMLLSIAKAPLETLEIDSLDARHAFKFFHPDPAVSKTTVPLTLGELLPKLQSLELRSSGQRLLQGDLLVLPSTLTRFSASFIVYLFGSDTIMSMLPRTLIRLESTVSLRWPPHVHPDCYNDWSHAPPHLEYIGAISSLPTPRTLHWLPKTLTACEFSWPTWSLPLIKSLPPKLRSFIVKHRVTDLPPSNGGLHDNWLSLLPRPLVSLTITVSTLSEVLGVNRAYSSGNEPLRRGSIAELPIQDLQMIRSSFPSTLMSLEIAAKKFDFEETIYLPRSLKYLGITFGSRFNDLKLTLPSDWLPPNLTDLHILGVWGNSWLIIDGTLPSSLESLTCYHMDHNSIANLPHSLTFLSADDIGLNGCLKLPPRLTSLTFAYWRHEWFSIVPGTVTSLEVKEFEFPTETDDIDVFSTLPPTLTSIILQSRVSTDIKNVLAFSPLYFSTLTCLQHLVWLGVVFTSAVLKNLPRKLSFLTIELYDLNMENMSFLPPDLRRLSLKTSIKPLPAWLAEYWPVHAKRDMPAELRNPPPP